MLSVQHLTEPSQNSLNQCNELEKCGFGNRMAHDIVDELFYKNDFATATDISNINATSKTPWDPNEPMKWLSSWLKMPKSLTSM